MKKSPIQTIISSIGPFIESKTRQAKTIYREAKTGTTPATHSWEGYLAYSGTVAVVLLILQGVTGLMLALHYEPYPLRAFASLLAIRNDVDHGMLIANMHAAGSKIILLVLFVHMFRIMLISAHRGPRAPQWYVGMGLLFLMLFTGFSGYLLPWSQQSYWACVVGTESLRVFPVVGGVSTWLLRGGAEVSGPTLTRFYWLHITLLPLSIMFLTWWHLKMVWRTRVAGPSNAIAVHEPDECIKCGACGKTCSFEAIVMAGNDEKPLPFIDPGLCNACRACVDACPTGCLSLEDPDGPVAMEPILPHSLARRAMAVCGVLAVYFGMVFFFSHFHKIPADPMLTPDKIKPDWYFLASYQLLKVLPSEAWGLLTLLLLCLAVTFLPFFDKSGPRAPGQRPLYTLIVTIGIAGFVFFTLWGWIS